MQIVAIPQYRSQEVPQPGDRISDRDGSLGTVVEVRTKTRNIGYGDIAVKWDQGVVVIHHSRADEFVLVSRGSVQVS